MRSFKIVPSTLTEVDVPAPDHAAGYFSTQGSQIVDADTGEAVNLVGANWFGAEGTTRIPGGLWARNYKEMMQEMADQGINTLRIPISPEILIDEIVIEGFRKDLNPDLVGMTPLEIMDTLIDYAGQLGIRVILDMHRIDGGAGKQEDGLWFSEDFTIEDLADVWQEVASHYADNPTVIGADVFNEPSGLARWGDEASSPEYNWASAAEYLGNAILEANPDLLILVQGVHIVDDKWYWVGGNLRGAEDRPIELSAPDKLVYSVHDYPYSVQNVPWLQDATAEDMKENFQKHWGYLIEQDIAPVLIGETGGWMNQDHDTLYMDTLFAYLEELDATSGGAGSAHVTWWGWNPTSHDTGGLLEGNWKTLNEEKMAYLDGLDADMMPTSHEAALWLSEARQNITLEIDDVRSHDRSFLFTLKSGTAQEGVDFLANEGVVTFKGGESLATIPVVILPDADPEALETIVVEIAYMSGGVIGQYQVALDGLTLRDVTPTEPVVDDPKDTPTTEPKVDPVDTPDGVIAEDDTDVEPPVVVEPIDPDEFDVVSTVTVDGTEVEFYVSHKEVGGQDFAHVTLVVDGSLDGQTLVVDLEAAGFTHDQIQILPIQTSLPGVFWDCGGVGGFAEVDGGRSDDGPLTLDFCVVQTWNSVFQGKVTLTNTGTVDLQDWTMDLAAYGLEITEIHKVTADIDETGIAHISGPSWDTVLEAGESLTFGVKGIHMTSDPEFGAVPTVIADKNTLVLTQDNLDANGAYGFSVALPEPDAPEAVGLAFDGAAMGEGSGFVELGQSFTVDGVTVTMKVETKWDVGFSGKLLVHNDTGDKLENWTLDLDPQGFDFTDLRKVNVTDNTPDDGIYEVFGEPLDRTINDGATVKFGFNAEYANEAVDFDLFLAEAIDSFDLAFV